ncbi:hypothetical protein K2224_17150 [Streptomyces sp. BHT-5-2]|uniref:hypothetical protein n=1 Tax=Streptomyces sp. BHT-5-2 TaxID=2866715 RepID=UPI001C8CF99D|nr:hypothetical protein [Streptomyces sp. BHT-5-2]QZL04663.1 hypothetical protein K2224_17150 [Streptomyces sp. BHT-5-2]
MRAEINRPGGRKVVALVTVALELWSPGHWPANAPMAAAWPLSGIDDRHSTSWADYGVTTGPGVFHLTVHAQVGGRPLLAGMAAQILDRIRASGDVWVATHAQVAEHALTHQGVTP